MRDIAIRKQTAARGIYSKVSNPLILQKAHKLKLQSAVGIVVCEGKVLLGLAIADDERDGKWCFPGGGIDEGEDTMSAGIRECYEEMGISAHPISQVVIVHPAKPTVGFVFLTCNGQTEPYHNEEFKECKWFPINELPKDMLSINIDILQLLVK